MGINRKIICGALLLVLVFALSTGCGSEKKSAGEDNKRKATSDTAESNQDDASENASENSSESNDNTPAESKGKNVDMKLNTDKMKAAYTTYSLLETKSHTGGLQGISYSELKAELGEPDEAYERIHIPKDEEYGPSIWRYKSGSYTGSSDVSSYVWYLDGGYYINALYYFQNAYMSSLPNSLLFGIKGDHFMIKGDFPFNGTYWYDVYKLTEEDEKVFAEIVEKIGIFDEKRIIPETLSSRGVADENLKILEELFGDADRGWGSGLSYIDFDYGNFTISCLAMGADVTPVFIAPKNSGNNDISTYMARICWDSEFDYGFDMEYAKRICSLIDYKTTFDDVKAILGEADFTRKNEVNQTEYCYQVGKQTVYISEQDYGLLVGIEKNEHNGEKNFRHDVRRAYNYADEALNRIAQFLQNNSFKVTEEVFIKEFGEPDNIKEKFPTDEFSGDDYQKFRELYPGFCDGKHITKLDYMVAGYTIEVFFDKESGEARVFMWE